MPLMRFEQRHASNLGQKVVSNIIIEILVTIEVPILYIAIPRKHQVRTFILRKNPSVQLPLDSTFVLK